MVTDAAARLRLYKTINVTLTPLEKLTFVNAVGRGVLFFVNLIVQSGTMNFLEVLCHEARVT